MASDAVHDLNSLISSKGTESLVRNNGDQVKVSSLEGKNVGLYFSASWCPPCCLFTPRFAKVYEELSASSKSDFEVIYVSYDKDEKTFKEYFSKMPWLSIPFPDSMTKESLKQVFKVNGIPHLTVVEANGKVATEEGVDIVSTFGVDAYPFTAEKLQLLKEKQLAEPIKNDDTSINSLLASSSRSYVLSKDENQIPISELEGKLIGLYFSQHGNEKCDEFTPILIEVYNKLKEKEEKFEIVLISLNDEEEDSFKQAFKTMPWLALPFKDEKCQELKKHFEVSDDIPALVIIGEDGKTSNPNAVELIKEHGIEAYPFSPKKLEVPAETPNAELDSQPLKSDLSVCGARNVVVEKDKGKEKVTCCCSGLKNVENDEKAEEEKEVCKG